MANAKLIFTCAFLLSLIFSSGIISTEERSPKKFLGEIPHNKAKANAFYPTSLAHSPGMGHSGEPLSRDADYTIQGSHSPGIGHSDEPSSTNVGYTIQGNHSPGIGHSDEPSNTNVGSAGQRNASPGTGHAGGPSSIEP